MVICQEGFWPLSCEWRLVPPRLAQREGTGLDWADAGVLLWLRADVLRLPGDDDVVPQVAG